MMTLDRHASVFLPLLSTVLCILNAELLSDYLLNELYIHDVHVDYCCSPIIPYSHIINNILVTLLRIASNAK